MATNWSSGSLYGLKAPICSPRFLGRYACSHPSFFILPWWLVSVDEITEAMASPPFMSCETRWYATCAVVRT